MQRRLVLAVVLASMLGLAACSGGGGSTVRTTAAVVATIPTHSTAISTGEPDGVVAYRDLSNAHTTGDVSYDQNPPVGGPHDPRTQPCAFYDTPIRTERGVHSMEHGAVWITYLPTLPADQIAELRAMVTGHTHLLISPYDGLPSPVVATAWGEQLVLQSVTDPRLAQFVAFFEEGPQTPELGNRC